MLLLSGFQTPIKQQKLNRSVIIKLLFVEVIADVENGMLVKFQASFFVFTGIHLQLAAIQYHNNQKILYI